MRITILGAAAGGGFPQWNCNCRNCAGVRNGTVRAKSRTQSSIFVRNDTDADGILFKSRHVELVAKTRQLLEEIGATEISTHWPAAHAPTKIKPTGTSRETDADFRITTLSYEMQFRIT